MAKRILNCLNTFIDLIVSFAIILAGLYSAYALWDNHRVYAAAENVQADMLRMKPAVDAGTDNRLSFAELREVNPDVRAWLTLENTKIDYPVLQGENNLSYINTDVYGNFALAGSIFLDSRCDSCFNDAYSLLYGHHMDNNRMFGDLDLYKNASVFFNNSGGLLILPEQTYKLEIFSCMLVSSSEKAIFETQQWSDDINGLLDFVQNNSIHLRQSVIDENRLYEGKRQILAMSTCASEFTDARTVVLAVMKPQLSKTGPEDAL